MSRRLGSSYFSSVSKETRKFHYRGVVITPRQRKINAKPVTTDIVISATFPFCYLLASRTSPPFVRHDSQYFISLQECGTSLLTNATTHSNLAVICGFAFRNHFHKLFNKISMTAPDAFREANERASKRGDISVVCFCGLENASL